MKVDVFQVSSFTANGSGGNPAGVVLNADHLSDEQKLKIAQAVGYSETAFVSRDEEVDFDVSFFTVTGEVDFCGHATLAIFSTMFQQGLLAEGRYIQRTKAGLLAVSVASDGQVEMELSLPEYLGVIEYEAISELIGIDAELLESTQLPIEVVSTGLPDIMVPVPYGYLDSIRLNEALTKDFCKKQGVIGIHAFELCEEGSGLTAGCRNFAPLFGIPEESATGSASGALACYLAKHVDVQGSKRFTFEQGRAMGCSSKISASVDIEGSQVMSVKVGGYAKALGQLQVAI